MGGGGGGIGVKHTHTKWLGSQELGFLLTFVLSSFSCVGGIVVLETVADIVGQQLRGFTECEGGIYIYIINGLLF